VIALLLTGYISKEEARPITYPHLILINKLNHFSQKKIKPQIQKAENKYIWNLINYCTLFLKQEIHQYKKWDVPPACIRLENQI
jgi:hypothetical protein